MKNSFRYILAATAILALQGMDARVKLPAILSDGMVVQRGEPVRLWGTRSIVQGQLSIRRKGKCN